MSLPPAIATVLGRGDRVRAGGVEGQGQTQRTENMGQGRVYGRGQTAVGLAASAKLGSTGQGKASFDLDTGTISVLMLAGITLGVVLFYGWTHGSQA